MKEGRSRTYNYPAKEGPGCEGASHSISNLDLLDKYKKALEDYNNIQKPEVLPETESLRETYVNPSPKASVAWLCRPTDNLSSSMANVKSNYTDFITNNIYIFSFCALLISTITMYAAIYPDHVSLVITDIKNTFLALVLSFFLPG